MELLIYLDRPELHSPVNRGGEEEVREVNGSGSGMGADPRHWPLVALIGVHNTGLAAMPTCCKQNVRGHCGFQNCVC